MSKLRQINARNVKGQTFTAALSGADLFVGPNGAGKSTRILAVLAAARGLAESPADPIREYLGPARPKADVRLDFGSGVELVRDLSLGNTTTAAKKTTFDADRLMGPHVARWDLGDFARATDKDRTALLERICSAAGTGGAWTLGRVEALLRKEMGITRDAPLPGTHPLSVAVSAWSSAKPIGSWLTEQAAEVDKAFTAANAAAKRAADEAAAASARLDENPAPAGSLGAKRTELAKLEADGKAIAAQLATAQQAGRRATEIEQDRQRAALAVDAAEAAVKQAEEAARSRKASAQIDVDHRVKDLATAREALAQAPDQAGLLAAVEAARDRHEELKSAHALACHRFDKASRAHVTASLTLSQADGGIAALRQLAESTGAECVHCHGADPLGLRAKLERESTARAELAAALDSAKALLDSRHAASVAATAAVEAAAEAFRQAGIALTSASLPAAQRAARDAETALERAKVNAADNATAADRAVEAARVRLTAAQEAHAAVNSRTVEVGGGDLDTLTAQHEALQAEYKRARKEEDALVRHEERARLQQDAVSARAAAAERFAEVKALKAALVTLRAEVATSAYGPIQAEANAFLQAAGIPMTVEFRDEADFGAVVEQRDGTRPYVAFWGLSDAQRAEFSAALAVAIVTLTKAPWRGVMLDRMEAIEGRHLIGLLRAAGQYVKADKLDNFIGTLMCESHPGALGDFAGRVHWLGAPVAMEGAA